MDYARRRFFLGTGASLLFAGCAASTREGTKTAPGTASDGEEEDVSPSEDLMREHGALNRVLLIYDESARRLETNRSLPIEAVEKGADVIRRFIEQYHEKLEEDFLFPRFEKASMLVDLVGTLRRQHQAGRTLTEAILRLATQERIVRPDDRAELVAALGKFTRMYRPHEAREDTVLFPALPRVTSEKELDALGEQFEEKEHQLFGKNGFEGVVEEIAGLEKLLGIYDLDAFTPS